jgi:hypothetical protein
MMTSGQQNEINTWNWHPSQFPMYLILRLCAPPLTPTFSPTQTGKRTRPVQQAHTCIICMFYFCEELLGSTVHSTSHDSDLSSETCVVGIHVMGAVDMPKNITSSVAVGIHVDRRMAPSCLALVFYLVARCIQSSYPLQFAT